MIHQRLSDEITDLKYNDTGAITNNGESKTIESFAIYSAYVENIH